MNIALWIVQALLTLAFLGAGIPKATQPLPALAKSLPWTADIPASLVRFIGVAEILGAVGVAIPAALYALGWWKVGVFPSLTIAAGIGLAVAMISAVVFHLTRREGPRIVPSLVLLLLALFVVVGRIALAPIG